MLVLTRRHNEVVTIGGCDGYPLIEVTVVEIRGDKVRIGFEAPKDVAVHRKEVYLEIQQQAAIGGVDDVAT